MPPCRQTGCSVHCGRLRPFANDPRRSNGADAPRRPASAPPAGFIPVFRYTVPSRAIGATVSAGALHAQGWGFESLIAHPRNCQRCRTGTVFVSGPLHRDSNPVGGAELGRCASISQRSAQGPGGPAAGGRAPRGRHPSSPTPEWSTVPPRHRFRFGPLAQGDPTLIGSMGRMSCGGVRRAPTAPTAPSAGDSGARPFVFQELAQNRRLGEAHPRERAPAAAIRSSQGAPKRAQRQLERQTHGTGNIFPLFDT